MQWTMPHRVLQVVAGLIVLSAATSFTLGVMSTPQRSGRLPGQKAPGAPSAAAPIAATEATPLSQERIEGPPPAPEKPKAEAEVADEVDQPEDESAAGNVLAAGNAAALAPPPPSGAGNQTPSAPTTPEEPPI